MTAKHPAARVARSQETRTVVDNRQARHLFFIEDTYEAGLVLEGWEVKAILAGQANFNGGAAYIRLENGEAFIDALTITPLANSNKGLLVDRQPNRRRKLLLHKAELLKLGKRIAERGFTLVPLSLTFRGKLKLQVGLAKGKKQADKRATLKERDIVRDVARELRSR